MSTSLAKRVASRHLSRTACIIAAGEWGDSRCLLKNRDRNYTPVLRVIREVRAGVEVVYVKDEATDWVEGMNEHGIGVVNTALLVQRDENEKEIVKNVGKKTRDGERILEALSHKTLDEAVESVKTFDGGIKGHTFVSNADRVVAVEMTSEHDALDKPLSSGRIHIRTNHGIEYPDAGYTDGEDYVSSVARRDRASDVLDAVRDEDGIALALMDARREDRAHPNNMVRDTDNMRTSSHLVLNLTEKVFTLYLIPKQAKYVGFDDRLPDGHIPKIDVRVFRYTGLDAEGGVGLRKENRKVAHELPAPSAQQEKDWTCGPAAAQVMLGYYDLPVPEEEILVSAMDANPESGTSPENLARSLMGFGLLAQVTQLTLANVLTLLDDGYPVIMNVQGWGEGHYAVAVGYKANRLLFADPYRGTTRTYITFDDLDRRWVGDSGRDHLAIVAMPPPPSRMACVIGAKRVNDGVCLVKNRDLDSVPRISLVREVVAGTEAVFLVDECNGWAEGINAHGIALVSSSLPSPQDPQLRKTGGSKWSEQEKGDAIRAALGASTLDGVAAGVLDVPGHHFVTDGLRVIAIEKPQDAPAKVINLDPATTHVRTNHGVAYPDAGYGPGPHQRSSLARYQMALRALSGASTPDDLAESLMAARSQVRNDPNSVIRDTGNRITTAQLLMNPARRQLVLYLLRDRVVFSGVQNRLPPGWNPIIDIDVRVVEDADAGGFPAEPCHLLPEVAAQQGSSRSASVACPLRTEHYGGLPEAGEFKSFTEYEIGLQVVSEAAHCILGSLGRHLGPTRADWDAMRDVEGGHIREELGIIERAVKEYSKSLYEFQFTRASLGDRLPEYREESWKYRVDSVESIRRNAPKLRALTRDYGRALSEQRDVPVEVVNVGLACYGLVAALCDAAVDSLQGWPDKPPGNAFRDARVPGLVRKLRQYVDVLFHQPLTRTASAYFGVGDEVFFGKYKNKRGKIVRLFTDERGIPSVEIQPIPQGRKKNKVFGLFKIWHADLTKRVASRWLHP